MDQQTFEIQQSYEMMVEELSGLYGILPEYWDIFGKQHWTTFEAKQAMLRAMKLKIDSEEDIAREIRNRKNSSWTGFVEPVFVVSVNNQPVVFPVFIPAGKDGAGDLDLTCSFEDETGHVSETKLSLKDARVLEEKMIEGRRYIKVQISDTVKREIGYYRVKLACRSSNSFPDGSNLIGKETKLIITPDVCYIPEELRKGKAWGLSVNLYSLQSKQSWGIGDFKDLRNISEIMASRGAGFIGINPLHALPNTLPYGISPYSPFSRIYKNFIYLDMDAIPEVTDSEVLRKVMKEKGFANELREAREAKRIDYERVCSLKQRILGMAFDIFYEEHYQKNSDRGKQFRDFLEREGESLELFATFMALWEKFRKELNVYGWQGWPPEFHDPRSETVKAFRQEHGKDVLFYSYLQWLIDEQLQQISSFCEKSGMKIGLYDDLAVGAIGGGSDVWSNQEVIGNADVGAPPDDFNPNGQNWGFPPIIPGKLKECGYELFIDTIRENMKNGGALRIDHALGLYRLFWIPAGLTPKDGAYLLQPVEDLLRIIALESTRNRTVVIAEDLGTIDDRFREMLNSFQMLSYRLFYFERNYPDPSFKMPEQYPQMALCAITTHDLPTIYGYWTGRDIKAKKELGIYKDEEAWRNDCTERERDKGLLLSSVRSAGLLPEGYPEDPGRLPEMTNELCLSIYRYLGKTPCKLLLLSLDDILGTPDQQNMPGTVDAYPNWMQRTSMLIEDMAQDVRFEGLKSLF